MDSSPTEPQCMALRSIATFAKINSVPAVPPLIDQSPLLESTDQDIEPKKPAEKTVLYLAYGSNLAAKTFQGRRKIQPLRAINVMVPGLQLVFDLAGVPYMEPCFANTRKRDGSLPSDFTSSEKTSLPRPVPNIVTAADLGWSKGLVGVVYEVTESDFARIIATEGGGSSYGDIEIPCYPLPEDTPTVPSEPTGTPFIAHTLFADTTGGKRGRIRRDGRAEPSVRYLGLMTTGAAEHNLPPDYQSWLQQLKAYRITTWRQSLGKGFIISTWAPFMFVIFGLQLLLVDKNGRIPAWLADLAMKLFTAMWISYDRVYKRWFGDGERTIGDPPST